MAWFNRKSSRPPEQLAPPHIDFVGEQEGPPERELKKRFITLFDHVGTVQRAYLARTDYCDGTGIHEALCVRSTLGEDMNLNSKVAAIFAEMFGSHEHLDVLFVREDQEQRLRQVCSAFYEAG